jgi:ABC-type antimicrobial peptide transport system permease subunit
MIYSYLKIALRNLWRNKLYTFINVLGLSIGISACLLIYLLAEYELSFDRSWSDGDRIYRVYTEFSGLFTALNPGVATALTDVTKDQNPGFEEQVNFFMTSGDITIDGAQKFNDEEKIVLVAPAYFDFFKGQKWIVGDAGNALASPGQIVLTEKRARRYFELDNINEAVGKTLTFNDSLLLTVTGVLADPPGRSDFDFEAFISYATIESTWLGDAFPLRDWTNTNSNHQLFVKIPNGASRDEVVARLNEVGKAAYQNDEKYYPGVELSFAFQPLSKIHFNSELGIFMHSREAAHLPTIYTLLFIAGLLLFIAIINFINLETAQSIRRAKEVGIRKSIGGTRFTIMQQFLFETLLITLLAVMCSVGLAQLGLHYFSEYIPEGVALNLASPPNLAFLSTLTIGVTLLAGGYPAFVMSGFRPAFALKGEMASLASRVGHVNLRKGLIVFQFIVAQALIFGNLAIGTQLKFMLNKDLGFDKDAIVYTRLPYPSSVEKRKLLASRLQQIHEVESVSLHQQTPSSRGMSTSVVTFEPEEGEPMKHNPYRKFGDTSFIHLYGIELVAGRNLLPSDTTEELLINQAYAGILGFENPEEAIGKHLEYGYGKLPVVGVVKDFHQSSLHQPIEPVIIGMDMRDHWLLSMKLKSGGVSGAEISEMLQKVEGEWSEVFPGRIADFKFLDETLASAYQTERKASVLTSFAMGVAILISCLGLLGLISYTAQQRTKEIGIRKVLGASIQQLVVLLTKDFILLVLIASSIALPLAWYLTRRWLDDFAFSITIHWWMFAGVAAGAIFIALMTISFRAVSTALANPADSLKAE